VCYPGKHEGAGIRPGDDDSGLVCAGAWEAAVPWEAVRRMIRTLRIQSIFLNWVHPGKDGRHVWPW